MEKLYTTGDIAKLRGTTISAVNQLLKRYKDMQSLMVRVGGRKLFTEAGMQVLVTFPDHRRRRNVNS